MALYNHVDIRRHCGDEAATYARNKQRGGKNGAKGFAFELACAAYFLVLAAHGMLTCDSDDDDIYFIDQVGCFIDDLGILEHRKLTLCNCSPRVGDGLFG
jgi:hypothetical protein